MAPSVSPGTHDPVATQAYQAGGGDYFRSGYYYSGTFGYSNGSGTMSVTIGSMYVRPFWLPVRRSFDRIAVNVATAAATSVLRSGIYSHESGVPTSLIVDGGTASAATTGLKELTISATLEPGLWWLAVVAQVAQPVLTSPQATSTVSPFWGVLTPTGIGVASWPVMGGVTGALPATFTASNSANNAPNLTLRAA